MTRNVLICFCLILFTAPLYSQTIVITDTEENLPVSDVAIYNLSRSTLIYSNRSGKAEISVFASDGQICFHHFAFESLCLSHDEIKNLGYCIRLKKKVFPLDEYVVSASRWEQSRNEVPNKISVLPVPVIHFRDPQTAADLISASDEVFVQKSQLGGGSPMIRGFATNRVLIVVDGVRMNNAIYREGNIQNVISLDPNSIESTEIIFGPGAYIYGSDAIGGVMDFHTKKALFSSGEKPYFSSEAFARYSSADKEKTGHLDFNIGGKRISFLSAFSYSDFDDLKMGSGKYPEYLRNEYVQNINGKDSVFTNPDPEVQRFSGYNQLNTTNKLRIKISEKGDLVLSNHYSQISNVPRYDRLIQYKSGKPRYGDWYYGPQVWIMTGAQLTLSGSNKLYDQLKVIGSNQSYKESRHDRSFGKTTINEQFEKVKIWSVNIDADKKLKEENNQLFYGLEFVTNDIRSDANTRDIITGITAPAGSRYPNGENNYLSFSAYTGFKSNLSEKITFNTGLRYNYVSLYSTIADNSWYNFPFTEIDIKNGAVTGAAGFVFRTSEKTQININASTGFRAPNLDDAGKVFDSAPGVVVVPNPDLEPEYAYNLDLGASHDFGSFLHFEVTGFITYLNNAMVRDDFQFNGEDSVMYGGEMSKVEAMVNTGYAISYGVNMNILAKISRHITLTSVLNIMEGKEKDGVPLRHATPVFGSTHAVFENRLLKADLYALYNGPRKYDDMPPSEISKPYIYATDEDGNPWSPGWYTFNFRLSWNFSKWGSLNGAVENILNYRCRPFESGIVAPGRNFIISLRISV
jgi:hemoglobin/transferrin/lactoferrin receptor protein